MAETSYQLMIEWVQRRATPFVGWFSGDTLAQAIDAGLKAAREVGCKLQVRSVTVMATKRQRGEA